MYYTNDNLFSAHATYLFMTFQFPGLYPYGNSVFMRPSKCIHTSPTIEQRASVYISTVNLYLSRHFSCTARDAALYHMHFATQLCSSPANLIIP